MKIKLDWKRIVYKADGNVDRLASGMRDCCEAFFLYHPDGYVQFTCVCGRPAYTHWAELPEFEKPESEEN